MDHNDKSAKIICMGFWIIIFAFMMAAFSVLLTRQVLVKNFHINNRIVRYIYGGNSSLLKEADKFVGNEAVPIDWEKLYPHSEKKGPDHANTVQIMSEKTKTGIKDSYLSLVGGVRSDISNYVEKYHPWQLYMKWISSDYNMLTMGRMSALARENLYVAHDEWLYSYTPDHIDDKETYSGEDIEELADTVASFHKFLCEKDIGFLYASVSSKPCPYDVKTVSYNKSQLENSKQKSFLDALDERGVPEFDLSEMMPHDPDEWYELYYKTDPHWNDRGGMWASGIIANYLNDSCGFDFDPDMFEIQNYIEDRRDDYFRGQTARQVGPSVWKKEALTRYVPKFDTRFTITHYSDKGIENRQGGLVDVFFNKEVYDSLGLLSEKIIYDGTEGDHRFIINDDLYTIVNETAPDNADKRILVLRDSFATYFAPYFSTDVGRVDLVYMPKFTGSIRNYIEETKPDAVIMLQFESNIVPLSAANGAQGFHFDLW